MALAGAAVAQTATAQPKPMVGIAPDPAIAVGLEVFNNETALGRLHDVIDRNGQRYAIITAGTTMGQPDRLIAVPYDKLRVVNGKLMMNESWTTFWNRPTFAHQSTLSPRQSATR
ncbi:MAG: PRC-barrel domain-containing protein [Rhodospirillales bacterium]